MREIRVGIPLGGEIRHDVHVVPHNGSDKLIIHFLVAHQMRKTINAGVYKVDRIRVIEHMRIHPKPVPVPLVDGRAVQIRLQPWRPAVSVVDLNLDKVYLL